MALLYISEFASLGTDRGARPVDAPHTPALAEHALAIGLAAVQSPSFGAATRFVLVHADEPCCLAFGSAARVGLHRMAADETRLYSISAGSFLSVIESE